MPKDPDGAITDALQRWLEGVPATAHEAPLSPALKRATKEAEERIAQLERDARAYRRLAPADRSLTADRLRATLGGGKMMEVNANPEHQALQALTEPDTSFRQELLQALTVYYTRALSSALLSREHPRKLANDALDRHQAGLRQHGSIPAAPSPPPSPSGTQRRIKPMAEQTLRRIAQAFYAEVDAALQRVIEVTHHTPNSLPQAPMEAIADIRPQASFDAFLLHSSGCADLQLLQNENSTEAAEASRRHAEKRIPEIATQAAADIDRQVSLTKRLISNNQSAEMPKDQTLPEKPLLALWCLARPGLEQDPGWNLLLKGVKGRRAREAHLARMEEDARRREEEYEIHELELTPYQQAERRAAYSYRGPAPNWKAERLQQLWQAANPLRPMPRTWRVLAPDAPQEARESARSEAYLLDAYHGACDALRDQAEAGASTATQRRRQREAHEVLQSYLATARNTEEQLRKAGIEPPPPEDHEPLPAIDEDTRPRGTPVSQQTMTMPEVTVIPRRTKPRQPATAHRSPARPPADAPLQLPIA